MLFDHGKIHISLHKPIRFEMRTNALLSSQGLLIDMFGSQSIAVQMGETRSWFGLTIQEKWLTVTGLKPGSQTVKWYYENGCCSEATVDTHQITFIVDKDSASGESITVHKSGFYRGLVSTEEKDINYNYTHRGSNYDGDGPSKEFLFFDEAFRLCDKLFQSQHSPTRMHVGGFREWFCYLARNSMTGRLAWSEFKGLFQLGTHPGYHNALQRIVSIMRQAMDYGQLRQRELRCLIVCAEEVVLGRERKVANDNDSSSDSGPESGSSSASENSNQEAHHELSLETKFFKVKLTPKPKLKPTTPRQSEPLPSGSGSKSRVVDSEEIKNYLGIWRSVADRLKKISSTVEESIDDLAL